MHIGKCGKMKIVKNSKICTAEKKINTNDYVNSIKALFVMRDDYKEFPNKEFQNDDKFTAAFASRDIYNMCSRNFILRHLENYGYKAPIIIVKP